MPLAAITGAQHIRAVQLPNITVRRTGAPQDEGAFCMNGQCGPKRITKKENNETAPEARAASGTEGQKAT
jgi:hypothetical protein